MAKGIIFDFDGVIADSVDLTLESYSRAVEQVTGYHIPPEGFNKNAKGGLKGGLKEALKKYGVDLKDQDQILAAREEIIEKLFPEKLQAFPGVIEWIEQLHQAGFLLGIGTGAPRKKLETSMRIIGLDASLFKAIITGDDVEHGKPSPETYQKAMNKLQVLPDECIIIDDTMVGIESGKAAYAFAIGITNTFEQDQLIEAGADMVIYSVEDLSLKDLEVL